MGSICYSWGMGSRTLKRLAFSVIPVFAAAFVGSVATADAVKSWYPSLIKPPFNPPSWLFGPVWTLLYVMMAAAFYLVLSAKATKPEKREAVLVFCAQLVFNSLWSILFFGLRNPVIAFGEIVALWSLILVTILRFSRIDRRAAALLLPYLAWVSFAAVLNGSLAVLNS